MQASHAVMRPPHDTDADAEPTATGQQQYLTFFLGDEMFAVGILAVREIIEYGEITTVPLAPPFIRGVINLRGAVVPVVDLAVRFGWPPSVVGRRTCIVVVEVESDESCQEMGVVVDAVSEVLDVPTGDIEPPPQFGAGLRSDFVQSMGKVAGRFVVILNIGRVLAIDEIAAPPPEEAAATTV